MAIFGLTFIGGILAGAAFAAWSKWRRR